MKNITLTAPTPSTVHVCVPTGWRSLTTATPLAVSLLTTGHATRHGESSVFGQKLILGDGAMKRSGYGFGRPVDVDAQRVRVAAGTPPRSRPV
jgi:hypothetical protein